MRARERATVRLGLLLMAMFASPAYVWAQSGPDEPQAPQAAMSSSLAAARASKWSAAPLQIGGYATYAALQVLDVTSTLQALKSPGAREANPMMAGLVDHPSAFIAVKSATTLALLASLRQFSKTHPKASVLVMAAVNSGYACIVTSNFHNASGR
jgi:uncharacterized protein DUF5658